MGFCLLNNVAVAAAHARALGHERVLVLDWDVHHGNGTQDIFYEDASVLFISLHQFPTYPGTGDVAEQGRGEGVGATVNLALPKGGTDEVYAAALERIVLPIVEQFRPTFALVSAGFDAHERDPLAEMRLSAEGFASMTSSLIRTLDPSCRLGLVLEGGYDLDALETSSRAVASVLIQGPAQEAKGRGTQLPAAQSAALERIRTQQAEHWRLD